MNKKELIDFFTTENKSGWKCVESKLKNKNVDIYNMVKNHSIINNLNDLPFKEQVYCFIHDIQTRPICECSREVKYINISLGYQTFCSNVCSNKSESKKLTLTTNLMKKYGVKSIFDIPGVKDKICETMIQNYGVDNPFKSKKIKDKIKKALISKYGVSHPIYIEGNLEKVLNGQNVESIKKSILKKYGVENVFALESIKTKIKKTNQKRYGTDNPMNNEEIRKIHTKSFHGGTSRGEIILRDRLNLEHKIFIGGKMFDFKYQNFIIELDGDYWHCDKIKNLTKSQMDNLSNDKIKEDLIRDKTDYQLVRVRYNLIDKLQTVDDIFKYAYKKDYTVFQNDVIINKKQIQKLFNYGKTKSLYNTVIKFFIVFNFNVNEEKLKNVIGINGSENIDDLIINNIL